MRYFTKEWWSNHPTDEAPIQAYQAYFASIVCHLPDPLVEFDRLHTLHDARIKSVTCAFNERVLEVSLTGWNVGFERQVSYVLRFGEVSRFEQVLPHGRDIDSELGDLGYWEFELSGERIEMRMLFASGAEFAVHFESFSYLASETEAMGVSAAG